MNQEQYIVSLTSYPERIDCCIKAIHSLLNQKTNVEYTIVLTLAEPQFPGKKLPEELNNLIQSKEIELLWHPTDIRSHKKLMPVLKKYPNAVIIITDDDVNRPEWWLQMFIDDHKKYPNDVIVGESAWRLGSDLKQTFANNTTPKGFIYKCVSESNKILLTERPANGLGGVLYPVNTFTDKRFFDEELFMKLSPYSDESWQYCFNVIEDRTLRMCSKPTEWAKHNIQNSQKTALGKRNDANEYTRLYNLFFDEFPEYKEKMLKRIDEYDNSCSHIIQNKQETPTVICQLGGRLGNILFEIISAKYYAKQHNMPIKYYFNWESGQDYEYFKKCNINSILKEPIILTPKKEVFSNGVTTFDAPKEISSITYTQIPYESNKNIHITGNRQSEKYFTKQFAKDTFDFTDIDKEVNRLYGNLDETAAIHIRRTDYVEPKRWYRSLTEEDVHKIREKFPNDNFIIFSDDIEWCKQKFSDMNFRFSVKNDSKYDDSLIEFAAMRKCMAVLMSNSTFSWWAAYLSDEPGHVTVYKHPWFTYESENDIIPNDERWMTFEQFLDINVE